MADVTGADPNAEPSMEEILASIRRIIADEKGPAETAPAEGAADDALELTQMVQEDGSVVDVSEAKAEEPAAPVPEKEAAPPPPPPPAPEPKAMPIEDDELVSPSAAGAAASSLASLENAIQAERAAASPGSYTPLGHGEKTLENMVLELIKPMLKAWLDENLPSLVERLVQKEVERIARKS